MLGIIIYNTFWTSKDASANLVDRLTKFSSVIGIKWATTRSDSIEFERVCVKFPERFIIIGNNLLFKISFMMGARAIEMHPCNYWPEFGINLLEHL